MNFVTRSDFIKSAGLCSFGIFMPQINYFDKNKYGNTEMNDSPAQTYSPGNTPFIQLQHLPHPGQAEIWVKWEGANLTGSMKDRMAFGMIRAAEESGRLKPSMRVVEVTGGSTGSSLAMICTQRGYRSYFITTDAISKEKRQTMAALGAELEIMPSHGRGITPELVQRSIERVKQLADEPDTYWTNQFENPANAAGYQTLGEEIEAAGTVDAFVMGVGTGGCISGVASVLKKQDKSDHPLIVAVEPHASRNLSGGNSDGHNIEGIGIGFVPETVRLDLIDEIEAVTDEEAFKTARALARQEGLFAGPSSGANVAVALRIAERLGPGKRVVTILCDSGLRYLTGTLF
jgi:cysteine synthase